MITMQAQRPAGQMPGCCSARSSVPAPLPFVSQAVRRAAAVAATVKGARSVLSAPLARSAFHHTPPRGVESQPRPGPCVGIRSTYRYVVGKRPGANPGLF